MGNSTVELNKYVHLFCRPFKETVIDEQESLILIFPYISCTVEALLEVGFYLVKQVSVMMHSDSLGRKNLSLS